MIFDKKSFKKIISEWEIKQEVDFQARYTKYFIIIYLFFN